uniref:BHD_3 domain-containing protein n=1 Tax=Elaeophora elaphi TaxID=1147741 RepID=A0A0R3S1Y3_9BILA
MSGDVRRYSLRLQKKNEAELTKSRTDLSTGSVANYNVAEKNATTCRRDTRKRKGNISTSENQLQNATAKRAVKSSKQDEELKNRMDAKSVKRKRRSPEKLADRARETEDSAPKKKLNKKDKKCEKSKAMSSLSYDGSSCSDDEWEDVDEFDFCNNALPPSGSIEVTIKKSKMKVKPVETVEARRARYIKQHVNQKLRERQTNCHKDLVSMCFSVIPEQFISAAYSHFDIATAERFLHWFKAAYQQAEKFCVAKGAFNDTQVGLIFQFHRLEKLIAGQLYETDKDLASLLFLSLIALKQTARICLSCQPVPFKLVFFFVIAMRQRSLEVVESLVSYYGSRKLTANDYVEWPKKLEKTVEKIVLFDDENQSRNASTSVGRLNLKRNYWVEFWDENSRRWICNIFFHCFKNSKFRLYFAEYGIRDVTARYASKYLTPAVRRLWVSQDWWNNTLTLYQSKNIMRKQLEDVAIQEYLFSKPKPTAVAEYKNHPLYVLEKDLSKYETIYPENQEPIGKIKDFNIYPRSSVHRLDGAINWMKQLRSIKPDEKPYKVVEKRSCNRASSKYGGPRTVDLYGLWQTMPYVTPKIVDGRVPRNEFGNLYVYKNSMIPDGCVHLKLNGLVAVARQLGIDCVPAVVGWNHCRGGTHPILDGCVVLKEHEDVLREAWSKQYEQKKMAAKLKQMQRATKNWRRLVKGLLTLKKVRARFASKDRRLLVEFHADEKLESDNTEENAISTTNNAEALAWPQTEYVLPFVNLK